MTPTRRLSHGQLKAIYYSLTAVNTLATSYYFNYLFFLLRDRFGFGDRENLWMSALHGGIYIVSAWQCGKFAERRGFHVSLKVGFAGLFFCMAANMLVFTVTGTVLALAAYSIALLFIWPAMEALVTHNEPPRRVPHMVGLYNCVWSGAGAVAYFTGGPLYDWLGAGAILGVPAIAFLVQFVVILWADQKETQAVYGSPSEGAHALEAPVPSGFDDSAGVSHRPASAPTFLRLAWMANPLSYVAIYTLFAVMPGLALKLQLSATEVGLFAAIWMFARLAAFVALWQWTGWHYRFDWLAAAYVLLGGSFAVILMSETLWFIVVAQVAFGFSVGLIYYSSLFYSMDVGDARGEHGGLHEAAIGAGICAGPAIGAASIHFFPAIPNAAALAVTAVLALGFIPLLATWSRRQSSI